MGDEAARYHSMIMSRIKPLMGRNEGNITIDSRLNEISLHSDQLPTRTCCVDKCCEYISEKSDQKSFSTQDAVWDLFKIWLSARSSRNVIRSSVLVVGSTGSGKSYTLYGKNNRVERGLIPRFLEYVFSVERAQSVVLAMCTIENDVILDLLEPPRVYSAQSCLTSTLSLGTINMRTRRVFSQSVTDACAVIGRGLSSFSTMMTNRNMPFSNSLNLITTISVLLSDNTVYTIDFVEVSDLLCLTGENSAADELTASNRHHKSTICLRDFTMHFPANASALTYLLQDSLGGYISCCTIACFSAASEDLLYRSNVATARFVSKMNDYVSSVSTASSPVIQLILDTMTVDINQTKEIINHLNAELLQLAAEGCSSIPQTKRQQLEAAKRKEYTNWIFAMDVDMATMSMVSMSSTYRRMFMLQEIARNNPSVLVSEDSGLLERELLHRQHSYVYKTKLNFLSQFHHVVTSKGMYSVESTSEAPSVIVDYASWKLHIDAWLQLYGILDFELDKDPKEAIPLQYWSNSEPKKTEPREDLTSAEKHTKNIYKKKVKKESTVVLVPVTSSALPCEFGRIPIRKGRSLFIKRTLYHQRPPKKMMHDLTIVGNKEENNSLGEGVSSSSEPSLLPSNASVLSPFLNYLYCPLCEFKDIDASEYYIIQLDGISIHPLHCGIEFFIVDGDSYIYVIPFPTDIDSPGDISVEHCRMTHVSVDGVDIREKTRLNDGSIICLGISCIFRIKLTTDEGKAEAELPEYIWHDAITKVFWKDVYHAVELAESNRVHNLHVKNVDRFLASVARKKEKEENPLMHLTDFKPSGAVVNGLIAQLDFATRARSAELAALCRLANYMSIAMGRDVCFNLRFREMPECEVDKYIGAFYQAAGEHKKDQYSEYTLAGRLYIPEIYCHLVEDDRPSVGPEGPSWRWTPHTCIERFFMMQEMYKDFLGPADGGIDALDGLYNSKDDAFVSLPDDELIGVSYLYPDALMYMLDIEEVLPIVNFKGYVCGGIQVSVRSWLDVMEVAPIYLSLDSECKLDSFIGQQMIMRFTFDSLQDLPSKFCSFNRLSFKFFYHIGIYTTPYSSDKSCNPLIGTTMILEQIITPDFIDFIQRGSMEIEVWGKRPMEVTLANSNLEVSTVASESFGDPEVFVKEEHAENLAKSEPDGAFQLGELEALKSEIEHLKLTLEKKNKEIRTYKFELESFQQKEKPKDLSSQKHKGGEQDGEGMPSGGESVAVAIKEEGSKTCSLC